MDTSAVSALANDRLIKVIVGAGAEQETFLLQEAFLRRASKVFAAALEHNKHQAVGKDGELQFPEDNVEAWKFMLLFILENDLPPTLPAQDSEAGRLQSLLVNCWILGDKYIFGPYQNSVMRKLLVLLRNEHVQKATVTKAVKESWYGSELRLVVVREIAHAVADGYELSSYNDGQTLYDNDFIEELINAAHRSGGDREPPSKQSVDEQSEYMVNDTPGAS